MERWVCSGSLRESPDTAPKSVQKLLVYISPHIIFRARMNHFDVFIRQTSRKVSAIIKIHCSKFDGNRSQTERLSQGENF